MAENQAKKTAKKYQLKQPRAFALAIIILVVFGSVFWLQKRSETQVVAGNSDQPKASPEIHATDTERSYLTQMIPHHQEAVDVSRYYVENGENEEIKKFAQGIIDTQSKEVWTMIGFYEQWFKERYPGATNYAKTFPDLSQYFGKELDKVYLQGMMEHHRQEKKMNDSVGQSSNVEVLRITANEMTIRQVDELAKMQAWLNTYP